MANNEQMPSKAEVTREDGWYWIRFVSSCDDAWAVALWMNLKPEPHSVVDDGQWWVNALGPGWKHTQVCVPLECVAEVGPRALRPHELLNLFVDQLKKLIPSQALSSEIGARITRDGKA